MLIFVSDIHLTDALHGTAVSKADTFERFWIRIQASRGTRPAVPGAARRSSGVAMLAWETSVDP